MLENYINKVKLDLKDLKEDYESRRDDLKLDLYRMQYLKKHCRKD